MTHRLHKFLKLAPRHQLMLVQAWFMLGWYRAIILLVPFKRITAHLQHQPLVDSPLALPSVQRETAVVIGRLVAIAGRYTPWQSLCLIQVLVTQRLLAKEGIPGQFHLGVWRTDEPVGISAHAWLQCGDVVVSGASGHERFTVVSSFGWGGRLPCG